MQSGKTGRVDVFVTTADPKTNAAPIYPTSGTHMLPLKRVRGGTRLQGAACQVF
jgi:hypothetical protein